MDRPTRASRAFLVVTSLLTYPSTHGQVIEQWAARYDGPSGGDDMPSALATDAAGNAYVTGSSGTIKYDRYGTQVWAVEGDRRALTIDHAGNACVTGCAGTHKYSPQGETLWATPSVGSPVGIAVDTDACVHVTGSFRTVTTSTDYYTVKYSSEGEELWFARYDGPGGSESWEHGDYASALAVDALGNVYVTGRSYGATHLDFATVKYGPGGEELWVARYDNEGGPDAASALAVDGDGSVYVTGVSSNGPTLDYATVKYSPDGNEVWAARYDGGGSEPLSTDDWPTSLAIDIEGGVCVTGGSHLHFEHFWDCVEWYSHPQFGCVGGDFATVKYSSAGEELWVARYEGTLDDGECSYSQDFATSIALDRGSGVYVTGYSRGGCGGRLTGDWATVKYSREGEELWVERYAGTGAEGEFPWLLQGGSSGPALTIDDAGNLYVSGDSVAVGGQYDYATVMYSQGQTAFLRADSNADGTLDISDPVATLGYLFLGTSDLPCLDAADSNDSGAVDLSDAVYTLGHLFGGGPAPRAPFGACGMDGTEDDLGCGSFDGCP